MRVTGKQKYLKLAQRFDKKVFTDPLAAHRDELKGLHANTHIPQVIAAARLYEVTGDKRYWNIADYFWNEVTSERAYCTGGVSNFEFWEDRPRRAIKHNLAETRPRLLRVQHDEADAASIPWSPRAKYMDYYERLLFNHRRNHRSGDWKTVSFLRLVVVTPRSSPGPSIHSGVAAARAPRSLPS